MPDLVLRGGRPWGFDGPADVLVSDGAIAQIGALPDRPGGEVIDISGRLVLPGFVDSHCHLDKTLYGGAWIPHTAGDALADRIANERRRRRELGLPDVDRMTALLERMVAAGTSYVRTHTDVDPEVGLDGIAAVAAVAHRFADGITVEQVAFPQSGILTSPGTAELIEEALNSGVGTVGGIDRPRRRRPRPGSTP